MKKIYSFLLLLAPTVLTATVHAQVLNGDLNHNGGLDVEDITLLINGYLTGEEEWIGDQDQHEAVDLGLSVKWATMNIGANAPEEYGDYFAWGETKTKDVYYWDTYKWLDDYENLTKYCTSESQGIVDDNTVLDPEDDAAHVNWGGKWRMPTYDEWDELLQRCTWEWTTQNDVKGRLVTGPNGNSIFLPAAGWRDGVSPVFDTGVEGIYLSSSLSADHPVSAMNLDFSKGGAYAGWRLRYNGFSVRAVAE